MRPFGEVIRASRRLLGLSLNDVAERLGCKKGYLSGIENSRVPPPKSWLVIALAKLLKFDQTDLLLRAHIQKAPLEVRGELAKRCFPVDKVEAPYSLNPRSPRAASRGELVHSGRMRH